MILLHSLLKDVRFKRFSGSLGRLIAFRLSVIYNADNSNLLPPEDSLLSFNHKIIIPISLSLFVLLGSVAAILFMKKKSE